MPHSPEQVNKAGNFLIQACLTNAYYVRVKVEGQGEVMLLDSGCTQSVIPRTVLDRLPKESSMQIRPVAGKGVLADGQKISLHGITQLTFRLGQKKYQHDFLVADIHNHILLGLDFLEANQCRIDFHNAQLHCGKEVVYCCTAGGLPLIAKVQVQRDTVIPARTECMLAAKINQLWTRGAACVEAIRTVPGLMVATSVHHPQGRDVAIRLMNPTDNDIRVKSGQVIAKCSPVDIMEQQIESTTPNSLPTYLQECFTTWGEHLPPDEKAQLEALLVKHQGVFSNGKFDVGRTKVTQHSITVQDGTRPIKQRPYRHGPIQEAEVERQVQELKQQGFIREVHGAWSSPVVLVKKKDDSWRFCVDYRQLNEVTAKDAYPLPRIDDSLDALGGSRLFSTLDLTSGYWQVELEESAKEKAAFVTRSGLWEWEVLPFGLTSAPSTFERLMETVLRGLHWKTLLIYLDDIIVFSKDVETHIERLGEVFTRLRQAGLKLKPSKCTLFAKRVQYLGHVVSDQGVETDETKVQCVRDWPIPHHRKDVRAFLGTCGYYRRFIPNYSEVSRPLSQLSSKQVPFKWDPEAQNAFDRLKECLTQAPILAYPDHSLPFILDTDASQVGTGAVLSQIQQGQERPIAYYSKMYSKEEANYCVTRQELLAIVKALKHFRPHLFGREFMVRTDHASLPWLLRMPNPNGQLARWLEILSEYTFQISHRKGLKHNNADGLSRQVCKDCKQCQRWFPNTESQLGSLQTVSRESAPVDSPVSGDPTPLTNEVAIAQTEDEQWGAVYKAFLTQQRLDEKLLGWQAQRLHQLWDHLRLTREGVLQVELPCRQSRAWRTVCPNKMRMEVVREAHHEAHFGFNKTLAMVRQKWYWPGMTSHIRRQVRCCLECQKAKPAAHRQSKDQNKLRAGRPWQIVAVDLCGPLPETTRGNTQILVLADHFTRWYDAIPIPDGRAETVARVLDERVFSYFGIPEVIHSDQGAQFQSDLFTACCQLWRCKKTRTAPYHPQGNSVVERLNRTMGNSLRAMLAESEHLEWDQLVPQIMRAVRATPHRITGETSNYLMLGRETRLPHDLLVDHPTGIECSDEEYVTQLQKDLQTAYNRMRQQNLDQARTDDSEEEPRFKRGDKVWLKSYFNKKGRGAKLQPKYVGPYLVTKPLPYQTYEMERKGKLTVQHEGRIKLCQDMTDETTDALATTSSPTTPESPPVASQALTPIEESVGRPEQYRGNTLARPKRASKVPSHLTNYWLNQMTSQPKSILRQNSVLGGSGVVNYGTSLFTAEDFPPLERNMNNSMCSGGPEKGRCGRRGSGGTQKLISWGWSNSPKGSVSLKPLAGDVALTLATGTTTDDTECWGVGSSRRAGCHLGRLAMAQS